jgi:radical SAM enzyme (TIGR01210 family)
MCTYGISSPVSADQMTDYVRTGLSSLPKSPSMMLLVSPSGSMLDEWEVPAKAREDILRLVRETACRTYLCETRAETITEAKARQYAEILDNKVACIEVGLESADPWILHYCVNKALSLDMYENAVQILRAHRIPSIANVVVGSAFLSPREAIEDAVQTVQWALAHGTDNCTVFPVHVKRWTLLEWLWKHGLYSPPSLWSLIEVLTRLGPSLARRVTISWYKIYSEKVAWGELDANAELGYLCSPSTCVLCQPRVISLLDEYRNTNDYGVILALKNMDCACKEAWRSAMEAPVGEHLKTRVARAYEAIGREVLGPSWWDTYGGSLLADLTAS